MKKLLLFIFLFRSIAYAQEDTVNRRDLANTTGFGAPDGKLVSKEIGRSVEATALSFRFS